MNWNWNCFDFRKLHTIQVIKFYYRALKQLYGLSKSQVRTTRAFITHIFCEGETFAKKVTPKCRKATTIYE